MCRKKKTICGVRKTVAPAGASVCFWEHLRIWYGSSYSHAPLLVFASYLIVRRSFECCVGMVWTCVDRRTLICPDFKFLVTFPKTRKWVSQSVKLLPVSTKDSTRQFFVSPAHPLMRCSIPAAAWVLLNPHSSASKKCV